MRADVVLLLRELRRERNLTQRQLAQASGVHEKTISSFETGERIDSLKLGQLRKILDAYGLTEVQFFGGRSDFEPDVYALAIAIDRVPAPARTQVITTFRTITQAVLRGVL